ncbi:MAG: hypothetical protein SWE60_18695 [Thermodesulfobacteriota bacterium]|nr:hypothetical protein [Thermodesulfobacteriota bacterium]
MDLFLSTSCPQCGADISFEEESTVLYCPYCGSALHVTGRSGVIRTYVAPREDMRGIKKIIRKAVRHAKADKALVTEKQLFFAPYWRIKGMVFRWLFGKKPDGEILKELKTKLLDYTFPAYEGLHLGLRSLGVRPAALKLFFFDRGKMSKRGAIMNVATAFDEAVSHGASISDVGLDETGIRLHVGLTRMVGERYGVIYFPFWMMKLSLGKKASFVLILDAVANKVTRVLTNEQWKEMEERTKRQPATVSFSRVSFIPFKCPNCGWDLPLNRFDVIHLCRTCHRAWMEKGGRFKAVPFKAAAPSKGLNQALVYVPFWVFQAQITSNGQSLKTTADLFAFSPLYPSNAQEGANLRPMKFYVPAVAIRNISAANKLATRVTQNQPSFDPLPKDRLQHCRFMGVFLRPEAATDMADVLLYSLTPGGNRKRQDFVKDAHTAISKLHLVWWPFYEQRLFLRDAICGCGIQKGALARTYEKVRPGT